MAVLYSLAAITPDTEFGLSFYDYFTEEERFALWRVANLREYLPKMNSAPSRRPFNLTVTQRRVSNALTLYARQKHLVHLAEEQVYEHEKTNSAIINILSHIVESRNFESGTHILHVRAITDILLRQLVAATNRCPLSQARIPTRSDSSGPKAAGIDRSRRFLRNGAQNRKEASWLTTNFSLACSPQRRR